MQSTIEEQQQPLPQFSSIKPKDIKPAVEQLIKEAKQLIETVVSHGDFSYASLVERLEAQDDRLNRYWSPISHMNSVVSSDELRTAHDACLPLISEYGTWVGQHEGLYKAFITLQQSDEYQTLSAAQKANVDNTVRDFTLSGVGLSTENKQRYAEIQASLSELSSSFSNSVLDATMAWTKLVEHEDELVGLPESAIAAAKQAATRKSKKGWLFTLDIPSYLPVMLYSENPALREEMYRAFSTRASDQGPNAGEFDNSQRIQDILSLRQQSAELLGFENYAALSLATKMADTPQQVLDFLNDLATQSKPQAERDLADVKAFAKAEYGEEKLNAWDIGFYSEKLKQQRYAISDEQLRPYFPEDKVVSGLFSVVSRLFGVRITPRDGIDCWHDDVSFYDIVDKDGTVRGSFYFDLYAREGKRGGAWMADCRVRRVTANGLQTPVAYLTCNFNGPVGDKPALFTHNEVVTLFHEFGHGIHHMLTKIDVAGVSGINGVAWDAVELPSQFLENWCWEKEALALISGHYQTGESLPKDLLDKMLRARNFQSAMQMVRQLEFSLFDMAIHQGQGNVDVQAVLDDVRAQVAVVQPPSFNRFQHSFSHIFAGGYAAGYYSYKWAEVLSADAFSRFEEEGIFNPKTGADFLHHVLEMGGSRKPIECFTAFRGREPDVAALLRHSGIAA
ncbi:oligopeptidase A [Alteromonas oceanisediminis]|uniref:oligopeptidase A n=1 Tax=Alteromonas oceanisediminis TaxID=2836180 RepID=UPI001BDB6671|nr:oligopeptidase A [Alteromonas oceanisediminis]MBT0587730.1 oligopeptidase A [Alteromonas oceanisediminis]